MGRLVGPAQRAGVGLGDGPVAARGGALCERSRSDHLAGGGDAGAGEVGQDQDGAADRGERGGELADVAAGRGAGGVVDQPGDVGGEVTAGLAVCSQRLEVAQ